MDFELFDNDEELATSFLEPIGDLHLRSALKIPNTEDVKLNRLRYKEKIANSRLQQIFPNWVIEPPGKFLGKLFSLAVRNKNMGDFGEFHQLIVDRAHDVLDLEYSSLPKLYRKDGKTGEFLKLIKESRDVSPYTTLKYKIMGLLQISVMKDTKRNVESLMSMVDASYKETHWIKINSTQYIVTAGELIALLDSKNVTVSQGRIILWRPEEIVANIQYLDTLRLICDKVSERDNVIIANSLGFKLHPLSYLDPNHLISVLSVMDQGLLAYGNDFYKAIKVYEALIVGITLKLKDTGYVPKDLDYLKNTLDDIDDVYKPILTLLVSMIRSWNLNFQQLSQLHGLFRLWGHPVIDCIAGVEKMRKVGQKRKIIHPIFPRKLDQKFKEKFFMSYFKKNKEYPRFSRSNDCVDTYLYIQLSNQEKINLDDLEYRIQDWDNITCEKTFQIPKTFNLSLIVADTAISPKRDELHSASGNIRSTLRPEWRRGVIKWIKDGVIDCLLLLFLINLLPTGLTLTWLIIGLYPKEREVNPVARMFSLMSLMMRAYFVVTEDLLSTHIIPHFPNISMTFDLLKLNKKMSLVTRKHSQQKEGGRTFCINIDFEKWNLNFRREVTEPLFQSLGRLFGLPNIYNRTYDIFSNSLMYLSDGSYMPKFDDELNFLETGRPEVITGHLGGNEGLRQKGWTLGTSLLLDLTCEEMKIDYVLMGQGDNQVLNVTIYSDYAEQYPADHPIVKNDIQKKLQRFLNRLYLNSKLIGLPIKPLETWVSDVFFAYGKIPIFEGVASNQSLKKISRCFPFSNEDIMTLDNALGSISATFSSINSCDNSSFLSSYICRLNQSLAIEWFWRFHPLGGESLEISNSCQFLQNVPEGMNSEGKVRNYHLLDNGKRPPEPIIKMMMMLVPKNLGGFNNFNVLSSHFRGTPDPITHSLVVLKCLIYALEGDNQVRIRSCKKEAIKRILRSFMNPVFHCEPSYSLLFSDPYALNLYLPVGTKTIVQKTVREQVKAISGKSTFAMWFSEMINVTESKEKDRLVEILSSSQEINPRIGYLIVKGTLFGYAESVVSKVDKTVTLSRMTSSKKDIIGTIWRGECRFLEYFCWRCGILDVGVQEKCTVSLANKLRKVCWKKHLHGVTSPCWYELVKPVDKVPKANYITISTEVGSLLRGNEIDLFNGRSVPYLGSKVQESPKYNPLQLVYGSDPLLSRPVNLLKLINWAFPKSSNLSKLIIENARSMTDYPVEELIDEDPLFLDDPEQKLMDGFSERGSMWNRLFSLGSHVHINVEEWSDSGDKGEKLIQFQSLMLSLQEEFLLQLRSNNSRYKRYWTTDCHDCIQDVSKGYFDVQSWDDSPFPCFPNNPYLFISEDTVNTEVKKELMRVRSIPRISIYETASPSSLCEGLVSQFFAYKLVSSLNKTGSGGDIDLAAADMELYVVKRINILKFLRYSCVMMWKTVYSIHSSNKRVPNWAIDKSLIVKRLTKCSLEQYKPALWWFMSEETLDQLSLMTCFSPPSSYPVDISHGLVSIRATLINFIQSTIDTPHIHLYPYCHDKNIDVIKVAVLSSFLPVIRSDKFCDACKWKVASLQWTELTDIESLLLVVCPNKHMIFNREVLNRVKLIREDWKELISLTPLFKCPKRGVLKAKGQKHVEFLEQLRNTWYSDQGFGASELRKIRFEEYNFPKFELSCTYDYRPYFSSPISIPTRAYCRVWELLTSLPFKDHNKYGIVVLGDGFGGSSLGVSEFFPQSIVYSWTLLDLNSAIPKTSHISRPPSHMSQHNNIKDLSRFYFGDVFSQEFVKAWSVSEDLKLVNMIISEIELNHYPKERTDYMTIIMTETLLSLKRQIVIIKIFLRDYSNLVVMTDRAENKYGYNWYVLSTPLVDIKYGEFWLVCVKSKCPLRQITLTDRERYIQRELFYAQEPKIGLSITSYQTFWKLILGNNYGAGVWNYNINDMKSWFYSVGVLDPCAATQTALFHQVRSFKIPQYVQDEGGVKKRYWFRKDEDALRTRLLCLIMSRLDSTDYLNDELQQRRNWRIKWVKRGITGIKKTQFAYPILSRATGKLTESEVNTICKYIPILRFEGQISHKEFPLFKDLGDSISFEYIPKHKCKGVKNKACFIISKTIKQMI